MQLAELSKVTCRFAEKNMRFCRKELSEMSDENMRICRNYQPDKNLRICRKRPVHLASPRLSKTPRFVENIPHLSKECQALPVSVETFLMMFPCLSKAYPESVERFPAIVETLPITVEDFPVSVESRFYICLYIRWLRSLTIAYILIFIVFFL